ncbi:uncharacterized protein KGF55_004928 [Candida pseudojiufengensis]|uniref:uncharacterized protein n=1 Tax=Candida pseudojiufengensis TaxID=497109 RepID=UPI002224ED30|nr:uncharacterized protein KGF55_004928 [Candida pseudojiufengensis]KAI5960205.1 hypothetical protein KGF55_004928 [Candida pseudojiufengensis]
MSIKDFKDDTLDISSINDRNDQCSINTYDEINLEEAELQNEENEIIDETNQSIHNKKPTKKKPWKEIFLLSFSSLGAIYGDLGTSPLYVLNTIKYPTSPPNKDDIYGAVSLIFYLFTIIVIFKYVCIVLVIGPNGESGGAVAIYAKIARFLQIGPKGVTIPGGSNDISDLQLLSRTDTTTSSIFSVSSRIEKIKQNPGLIKFVQYFILSLCFLGCSLVISDGLLTPTTSVLSAIGGIQIAVPSFNQVLAVSEVILIFLFIIQQFGSNKIGFIFAPIIFLWMIGLMICGIYNIVKYHPSIFAALSPFYAIKFLKNGGIDLFSGAMLSITGTEAMFSDISHFGRLPVQLTLGSFVYPALMFCYLGQGAYIVEHPEAWVNSFFLSLPGGTGSGIYWVMFVLATLSTVIASQALILSVFSIVSQLINLDCFPRLKIVHTSSHYAEKVYIPVVNWLLMIGVICTTAGFKNSNNVTAAYGLGISLDFLVTSSLIIICMFYVYKANIIWPILFFAIFVPLEVCLVVANLKKVESGAWFSLMVAALFMTFLCVWRWARSKKVNHEYSQRIKIGEIYPYFNAKSNVITVNLNSNNNGAVNENYTTRYNEDDVDSRFGIQRLQKYDGIGFMYLESILAISPNTLPQLYGKIVKDFVSVPDNFVFVGIRVLSIPTVNEEDRILIAPMKLKNHFKCILRFGFMENIQIESALTKRIINNIPNFDVSKLQNKNYPILHYFENDLIKCHQLKANNKNKFLNFCKRLKYGVRFITINYLFSPLNSLTQDHGDFVKCDDESEELKNKVFIGGVTRI